MCTVPAKKRSHFKYGCLLKVSSPRNFLENYVDAHMSGDHSDFYRTTLQIPCSKWTINFFTCNFLLGSGRWKKNKPPVSHDTSNYCRINCRPCYVAVWYQFSLNCCNCTFLVRCNRQVTYISMCSQMIGRKDRQYDTVHSTTFLRQFVFCTCCCIYNTGCPIDIVSSQLYVCHILVSKKCQLQAGTIHPRPLA